VTDIVRLTGLRSTPIDAAEVLAAVDDPGAGGVVSFTGLVRDSDGGRAVTSLEYVAHPDAEAGLVRVAEAVAKELPVRALAALHRTGVLAIGDVAVVVAASAPHRGEAFDAARRLIDDLKATVPIWKHQVFADGGDEWVGSP
jgi:molybdopterin synthase catalytic subunit